MKHLYMVVSSVNNLFFKVGWNSHVKFSSVFVLNKHARFIQLKLKVFKGIVCLPDGRQGTRMYFNHHHGCKCFICSFHFYFIISQCPPFGGPMRSIMPYSFSFAMFSLIFLWDMPTISAKSDVVTLLFSFIARIIVC